MEDKELIKSIKEGNRNSYNLFVLKYQGMIVNTCYGFLFNKEDAEDLAQEIFIDVYTGIRNFKEESKLSTWLYRIAINKSIDYLRRKNRKKRHGLLTNLFTNSGNIIEIPDNSDNPHSRMESMENLRVLNLAISKLPQNQNTVFRLNKFEGLSGKQIAEIMELSLSAVESLLHRAKTNLKKYLYQYYKNEFK